MQTLRTPDARFEDWPDDPFEPHSVEIPDAFPSALRPWLEAE